MANQRFVFKGIALTVFFFTFSGSDSRSVSAPPQLIRIPARTAVERTAIAEIAEPVDIDAGSVKVFASPWVLDELDRKNIPYTFEDTFKNFPPKDSAYHNYAELTDALKDLETRAPNIVKLFSMGKSGGLQNDPKFPPRDIWVVRVSSHPEVDTGKPAIIFLGMHHAREHLSAEVPLNLATYLVDQYGKDDNITRLVNEREILIAPMVNPDGGEWDIQDDHYQMWRKNLRVNDDGELGVDLNRNYGFGWGGPGASASTGSETYRGPEAFSEPETRAVRDFVRQHASHTKLLLTFHTFSELILYPWGHTHDAIPNERDLNTMRTMAKAMAKWNGYKPEQASDLYLASGDTTDWAYGELGILAFTFELSPKSLFGGGFYPGAKAIDKVFQANLKPVLYMIDLADDPYRVLR